MSSTTTEEKCPTCGAVISPYSPGGQCVRCLLEVAVGSGGSRASAPELGAKGIKRLGDYELLSEIGRGGMGIIWKARQLSLNRFVALKLLLGGEFANEASIKRFHFEAEAAANLDHPHIVSIYEVGQHGGWPYLAMKLIEGRSLAEWNAESRLRSVEWIKKVVEMLGKVARAVHFAHQRGILHRDLKPGNILIDAQGEPHVTDFGLAKRVTADGNLTMTGAILGSPYYMPPEQAAGKSALLSTATDTYSLGVILFQLLTGQLPFRADTPLTTLRLVLEVEPNRPRFHNPTIDHDLETICLKCLAKDPAARYESAAALANDLDRWARGEPILARPVGALERSWKWVARHPLKAALAGVSLLAVLGPLISTFYVYHFLLPEAARAHPIIGRDQNIGGFWLTFETDRVDRATMNFDTFAFKKRPRDAFLYFTNVPNQHISWASNLPCQVYADIPGAPDEPRSPVVHQGQRFLISQPKGRDRAYYVTPFGWKGDDVLNRAPNARLCIVLLGED